MFWIYSLTWTAILYAFYIAVALYCCAQLVYHKHDPVKTLSWTIVLLFLPFAGLIAYLYFGQNYRKNKIYNRKGVRDERIKKVISARQIAQFEALKGSLPTEIAKRLRLIKLNLNNNKSILTTYNNITPYFTGKDALNAMINSMLSANHYIHLQSYIIENDSMGTLWKNVLIQKAEEGVKVRVIYDDVGSWRLPRHYIESLVSAGIEIEPFAAVRYPWLTSKINYRNHRKILVIDGRAGFLGGVNIADRYYSGGDYTIWRDAHVKIEGEAVSDLQSSFLLDWYFIKGEIVSDRKPFFPVPKLTSEICFTQIITSGPDNDFSNMMQSYFTAITLAKKHLYIITPYFTPNETILNAIKVASLGGIDVRIIVPDRSDAAIAQMSSRSYFTELLEAQVKIYLFQKGFNHSKVISIDGKFCIIGSANLDNRSFEHNFEISAIAYNPELTLKIENQIHLDLPGCKQLQLKKWEKRSRKEKILEALARLFGPLL